MKTAMPAATAVARQTAARAVQAAWASRSPGASGCASSRAIRHGIARRPPPGWSARPDGGDGRPEAEILSSEIVPLADACRFLEREAAPPARHPPAGTRRPAGLARRGDGRGPARAAGLVLVIAPFELPRSSCPACRPSRPSPPATPCSGSRGGAAPPPRGPSPRLAAGGRAAGRACCSDPARRARGGAAGDRRRGRQGAAHRLGGDRPRGPRRARRPAGAGRRWSSRGATPCSSSPAPISTASARAVALRAWRLNGGATCIAPRRVFVLHEPGRLSWRRAARRSADGRLTLTPVATLDEALAEAARSPYALGASIFGPEAEAVALAARVRAGVVVINDLIVPTADPRLPFGGRRGERLRRHPRRRGAAGADRAPR